MAIPLFIPLARDRASAFRAAVARLKERHGLHVFDVNRDDLWYTIRSYVNDYPLETDVPAAVEKAIKWAALENPSVKELREAGEWLESALADYFESWQFIARALKASPQVLSERHWIREVCSHSIINHHRAVRSFADSWPSISEQTEKQRILEILSGSFVDIDDAFARISGMTREQWTKKVDGMIATGRTGE